MIERRRETRFQDRQPGAGGPEGWLLVVLGLAGVLLTLAAAAQDATTAPERVFGPYRIGEYRVIDGDTLDARLAVFPGFVSGQEPEQRSVRLRLRGVDTPELRRGPPCEREAAQVATDRLAELLAGAVVIVADRLEPDGLGRMVASVYVKGADGVARNVAHVLLREGLGREWVAGYTPWC